MKKNTSGGLARKEARWAYFFISPWIIGFVLLTLGPMLVSLYLSFSDYTMTSSSSVAEFNYGANYVKLLTQDPKFWHALGVTMTYALVAVPLELFFGFMVAFLLNLKVPGLPVWRTIFYLPSVTPGVAAAILWGIIFNPSFGIMNWFLSLVGIKGPGWLSSQQWALPALIIMSLWSVGGGMIIYLAGLQGIPTALYEAAEIDGASALKKLTHITIPLMTPVIFYNLIIGIIGTFQFFTSVYILTRGGPADATLFYNLYLYNTAFRYMDMGYASALAWVLFIITLIITLLVFKSSAMWVYYEGEVRR
jgi:multiple sugar transport system permease protein